MRIRICRKESKETIYWLQLLEMNANIALKAECQRLQQEAREFILIFTSILRQFSTIK